VILRQSIRPTGVRRDTRCAPNLTRQLSVFSTTGSRFVSIVRRAWMISTGDNGI
jgi:hypothetical protein